MTLIQAYELQELGAKSPPANPVAPPKRGCAEVLGSPAGLPFYPSWRDRENIV